MHLLVNTPHLIDVVMLTSPAPAPRAERSGAESRGSQKSSLLHSPAPASTSTQTSHIMVVKIRLARFGRRRAPFYNIVVAQARFVLLSSTWSPFQASSANPSTGQRETANRLKSLVCPPIPHSSMINPSTSGLVPNQEEVGDSAEGRG